MASPTTGGGAEVLALAAGSATAIDASNAASRQLVEVQNNGPQAVTIRKTSGAAPTITAGIGHVIPPGDSRWFWCGQGLRLYAKVGPVPAGETAVDQVTGAALWVDESV
jgi:hypothetical protein